MPKMTLLEMTQDILNATDGDEVNSISDTVESLQYANQIRVTYYDLIGALKVPSLEGLVQLDPSGDPDKPTHMSIPDNVKNFKWIKYKTIDDEYKDIVYLQPEEFAFRMMSVADTYVSVADSSGVTFKIINNSDPTYWTTFDNQTIIFDSFNATVDTTLQASKTMCWGQYDPPFQMEDDFVPYLDADQFTHLLSESTASCFINFKQISNSKEEQKSRRQLVRSQNDLWRGDQRQPYNRVPNYGRRR